MYFQVETFWVRRIIVIIVIFSQKKVKDIRAAKNLVPYKFWDKMGKMGSPIRNMIAFETAQFVVGAPLFGPEIQFELAEVHVIVWDAVPLVCRKCGM